MFGQAKLVEGLRAARYQKCTPTVENIFAKIEKNEDTLVSRYTYSIILISSKTSSFLDISFQDYWWVFINK